MGCGSCGGKVSPQIIQRNLIKSAVAATQQARYIMPKDSKKLIRPPVKKSSTIQKAEIRADGMRMCSICGGKLKTVLAGSGPKRRFSCPSCGAQFSK